MRTRPARCLQDISYADDAYKHFPDVFSYETVYNDFMNWMQNITARKVRALFTLPANRHSTVFFFVRLKRWGASPLPGLSSGVAVGWG